MQNKKIITLIQLGRLGDLIQTAIAIKDSDTENVEFALVCRKSFGPPLEFLLREHFKHIVYLDTAAFFQKQNNTASTLNILDDYIEAIDNLNSSAVINLTFSKSSSYLMTLLKKGIKMGQYFTSKQQFKINDCWSKYIYSNIMTGPYCVFNLVDIFRKVIGIQNQDTPVKKKPKSKEFTVVINPFSSHKKKNWQVAKWTSIVSELLDEGNIKIYFVGARSEEAKSQKLERSIKSDFDYNLFNLTGKTSLQETALILKSADLFLGHDSMASHLATYVGTQTLTVSLGIVRPTETIPYGDSHYAIVPNTKCFPCFPSDACDNFECHEDVPPYSVSELAITILKDDIKENYQLNGKKITFKILKTQPAKFSQKIVEITNAEDQSKQIFDLFTQQCWQFVFNDEEDQLDIPQINEATYNSLQKILDGLELLYEVNGFAQGFCKSILDESQQENSRSQLIKEQSTKLREIEDLTHSIKKQFPILTPIINYYTLELKLNDGNTIKELAENSLLAYHQMNLYIGILYDFINKTSVTYQNRNKAFLKTID